MAATGAPPLAASTSKPGGGSVMLSRWLIQHCSSARRPSRMRPWLDDVERGLAELAEPGARDGAAEPQGDGLGAVADAQHRDAELEDLGVDLRGVVDVHAHGAAREDDALGRVLADALDGRVVGDQLGVHAALAHAARDELPVLCPEIEHQDGVEPLHLRRTLCHARLPSSMTRGRGAAHGLPQPPPSSFCAGKSGLSPCRRLAPSAASCPRT